jgi:eukaryotic-like serine/threonine-protein kinase
MSAALSLSTDSLTSRAESFEFALSRDPEANLADFLPPDDHPLFVEIVGELVRIDLGRSWELGAPRRLADYRARFPALFVNPTALAPAALEEFRLRRSRGEAVSPAEYRETYRIDTRDWPATAVSLALPQTARMDAPPLDVPRSASPRRLPGPWISVQGDPSDLEAISEWVNSKDLLPDPGSDFLGFTLVGELGRGAFGRVYLAH